jgi:hypothetical protein
MQKRRKEVENADGSTNIALMDICNRVPLVHLWSRMLGVHLWPGQPAHKELICTIVIDKVLQVKLQIHPVIAKEHFGISSTNPPTQAALLHQTRWRSCLL